MIRFKGFSTVNRIRAPFTLTDSDLIKRDLLNEFYTKKGERVMRPNFGSIIWDILMDPFSPDLENKIREDVLAILGKDPRVRHVNTTILTLDHTIRVEIVLNFVATGNEDTLYLAYTREITEGTN